MTKIQIARGSLDAYLSEYGSLGSGELFFDWKERKLYIGGDDGQVFLVGKLKRVRKYIDIADSREHPVKNFFKSVFHKD